MTVPLLQTTFSVFFFLSNQVIHKKKQLLYSKSKIEEWAPIKKF